MPVPVSRTLTTSSGGASPARGQLAAEHQLAALGHRVAGVHGEVQEHLLELARVAEHRAPRGPELGAQLDVPREGAREQAHHLADRLVHVDGLAAQPRLEPETEQLAGELGAAPGGFADHLGGLRHLDGRGLALGEELGVAEHAGQQVVEVVGHAGRERADRLELLLAADLVLELDLAGHVAHHGDEVHELAGGVADRRDGRVEETAAVGRQPPVPGRALPRSAARCRPWAASPGSAGSPRAPSRRGPRGGPCRSSAPRRRSRS